MSGCQFAYIVRRRTVGESAAYGRCNESMFRTYNAIGDKAGALAAASAANAWDRAFAGLLVVERLDHEDNPVERSKNRFYLVRVPAQPTVELVT